MWSLSLTKNIKMRKILSVAVGVLTFIWTLIGANWLIHWVASGIQNHDVQAIVIICLWIICFSATVGVAILISILVSWTVNGLFNRLKR
jgi:hypothetical protein